MTRRIDLERLNDLDQRNKPSGANAEWHASHLYYTDQSRGITLERLRGMGLGLRGNRKPVEVQLIRRVVENLAVCYQRSPTRWLERSGTRLPEDSTAHRAMLDVLDTAQYDLAWREVDCLRALLRQVVLRVYPCDDLGTAVVRIFPPYAVMRDPSPGVGDVMDADREFALQVAPTTWEHWVKTIDGWACTWVDEIGEPLPDEMQPFPDTAGICPYPLLPVQIIYDAYTGGVPFLPPRLSRTAWTDSVNALVNDLWNLVAKESHTQKVVSTNDTASVPNESGPDKTWVLPKDAVASVLQHSPKIQESSGLLDSFVDLWTLSEDLPLQEFKASGQIVTGAAARAKMRPLQARREKQVPLAKRDERIFFRRLRGVHNLHRQAWNAPELEESCDVAVELAELEIALDSRELLEGGAKSLALGTKSVLDIIQEQRNVPRSAAVKIYNRVKEDLRTYPPPVANPLDLQGAGPKITDPARVTSGDRPEVAPSILDQGDSSLDRLA